MKPRPLLRTPWLTTCRARGEMLYEGWGRYPRQHLPATLWQQIRAARNYKTAPTLWVTVETRP